MILADDDYDQTVARVYDAGAGRIEWRDALEPLARRLQLWSLSLFGLARATRSPLFVHEGGLSGPEPALDYLRVYHRLDPHIGPALALECRRGAWLRGQDRFDDDFVARDPFFQEFLLPRGGPHTACAKLLEDEHTAVLILLQRAKGLRPLGDDELALFDRLRPHLASAVRMHIEWRSRLDGEPGLACRIFSRMRQALVLADADLRIVYANPAAQRLLARANAFSERNGHLVCRNREDDARLRNAVRTLADDPGQSPGSAVIRVVGSGFINPVMVLATGLGRGAPDTDQATPESPGAAADGASRARARVMLLLHDTARRRHIDPAVIGEVFQLTRAEAEVATGLAEGLSIEEIASARGVTLETVRAQIRAVYGKADVRSRADLVRMLLEMPSFDAGGAPGMKPR